MGFKRLAYKGVTYFNRPRNIPFAPSGGRYRNYTLPPEGGATKIPTPQGTKRTYSEMITVPSPPTALRRPALFALERPSCGPPRHADFLATYEIYLPNTRPRPPLAWAGNVFASLFREIAILFIGIFLYFCAIGLLAR